MGQEWTHVLASMLMLAPAAVVIAAALVMAIGGVIGCAKCLFAAMPQRRTATAPTRLGRPVLHH